MGMVVNKSLLEQSVNKSSGQNASSSTVIDKRRPIIKPQKFFTDKLDNSYIPFVSKLRNKPNQLVPLPSML